MNTAATFKLQVERSTRRHDFAKTGDIGDRRADRLTSFERPMQAGVRYLPHDHGDTPGISGVHRPSPQGNGTPSASAGAGKVHAAASSVESSRPWRRAEAIFA